MNPKALTLRAKPAPLMQDRRLRRSAEGWVRHPEVEAENNLAERRLRPMVIARKVCFGSQSDKGLKTRETLMSVIDTLRLRHADPVRRLSEVFAAVAKDRTENVGDLLWKQTRP